MTNLENKTHNIALSANWLAGHLSGAAPFKLLPAGRRRAIVFSIVEPTHLNFSRRIKWVGGLLNYLIRQPTSKPINARRGDFVIIVIMLRAGRLGFSSQQGQ